MHLIRKSIVENFAKTHCAFMMDSDCCDSGEVSWTKKLNLGRFRSLPRQQKNTTYSRPHRPALPHTVSSDYGHVCDGPWWLAIDGDSYSISYYRLEWWPRCAQVTSISLKSLYSYTSKPGSEHVTYIRYTFYLLLHDDRIVIRGISMRCGIDC